MNVNECDIPTWIEGTQMSTTNVDSESLGGEQKSSKDILNELFSTFNTSFDDDVTEEGRKKKKKKKKSKKKKSKKESSDSDGGESVNEATPVEVSPTKNKDPKKHHREKGKHKYEDGEGKKSKSKSKGKKRHLDDDEDVDALIQKHRRHVKNKVFKGIVSNIGDIVINNDELIKSKSKKREEDLRKAAGSFLIDIEDGEILEDERVENKISKGKHKKHSKLSASQAYKLDVEEKILLSLESVDSKKHHHHKDRSHSRSESDLRNHLDKRHSGESGEHLDNREEDSLKEPHHHRDRERLIETEPAVRQAPPRDPEPSPSSSSSRRSYNYKDTGWQKERDQYYSDLNSSNSNYSRRRERDYDVGNYYEHETSRRSDGRGFGFGDGSYYVDGGDHGDRRSHHHNQHDDRHGGRTRSRSPRSRSRSYRSDKRSRSRSPPRWRRSRSRSSERHRRHPDDIIDKAKLLDIARKNAGKLMRKGVLPSDIFSRDQIVAIRAGGKSVEELTDYCKRIAKKDARGDAMSDDSGGSDDDREQFIHHPFHVKDRPLPQITFNIRNAIPLPVRTPQELAIEGAKLKTSFPVSSGTQHRIKELEWHPVVDKEEEEKKAKAAEDANSTSLVPLSGPKIGSVAPMMKEKKEDTTEGTMEGDSGKESNSEKKEISLDHPKPPDFDISDVIAIRLRAMRQLSENPTSDDAKKHLEDATNMMKEWADAKALEPKFLTQSELTQGPQAWARRDQLTKAKEVQSPMGLHLLQKMGWKPGEGLGKFKAGDIEPLALEVKTDKKGLTSVLDYKKGPAMPLVFDLSGKHPISALMELCAKRKWGTPDFDLVFEHGPPHKRQFVYKVIVNGVEYQPCVAVNNKKLAKANAAAFCLQSLGLLPTCEPQTSTETLQTVPLDPIAPPPPNIDRSANNANLQPLGGFRPSSHYLQTVPTATVHPSQPPLPADLLMPPPPPPPPPLKKFSN